MRNSTMKYILPVVAFLIGLAAWVLGMSLLHDTFMPWWLPVICGVFASAVLMPAMVPRLTKLFDDVPRWICGVAHTVVWTGIFFFAVLGLNYRFASASTAVSAEATVVDKVCKERTRYRRVARNRYIAAGKYNEWYLVLELDGGRRYEQPVSITVYNRTRRGAVRHLPLQRGLFGYTVVKELPHSDE